MSFPNCKMPFKQTGGGFDEDGNVVVVMAMVLVVVVIVHTWCSFFGATRCHAKRVGGTLMHTDALSTFPMRNP